jgi:hypothetical protein
MIARADGARRGRAGAGGTGVDAAGIERTRVRAQAAAQQGHIHSASHECKHTAGGGGRKRREVRGRRRRSDLNGEREGQRHEAAKEARGEEESSAGGERNAKQNKQRLLLCVAFLSSLSVSFSLCLLSPAVWLGSVRTSGGCAGARARDRCWPKGTVVGPLGCSHSGRTSQPDAHRRTTNY